MKVRVYLVDFEWSDRTRKIVRRTAAVAAVLGVFGLGLAIAGVPNTFNAGDSLSAQKMNANFAALDSRLTAVEQLADSGAGKANNGCANGVVGQSWDPAHMVGCDCYGAGCVTPVRDAERLCSPGWHVCGLADWNQYRGTTLSTTNRYIAAIVGSCGGCNGDVLSTTSADICAPSGTACGASAPTFVGPSEVDVTCNPWPTGTNNGNVSRLNWYANGSVGVAVAKAACLSDPGTTAAASVTGTMCCQ